MKESEFNEILADENKKDKSQSTEKEEDLIVYWDSTINAGGLLSIIL